MTDTPDKRGKAGRTRIPGTTAPELPKRFYKVVTVAPPAETDSGPSNWTILLDHRGVRTPAKRSLAVPSAALADAVAAEWSAQETHIDPRTMPLTRLINTAIDGVAGREVEVRASILAYAGHDLLCYRADAPDALAERQAACWQPLVEWARSELGIVLRTTTGMMPIEQDAAALARIDEIIAGHDAFALAALHEITTLTGSLVLALACARRRLSPAEAWALAHIDEDFQAEQWGRDAEAEQRRAARWTAMRAAGLVLGCEA
jgi:chaperone required for assembly of F1-ATPase